MQLMPMHATSNHVYTQFVKACPTMSCILLVICRLIGSFFFKGNCSKIWANVVVMVATQAIR